MSILPCAPLRVRSSFHNRRYLIDIALHPSSPSQFKLEFGHTVVPQNSGPLGAWVHSQRVHYKKFKAGEKSQMTAEKALRLTEVGFCFNASDRFRGNKRHRMNEQTAAEEMQQQQHLQQQQHHRQLQQQQQQQQQHYQQQHLQEMQGFQPYI